MLKKIANQAAFPVSRTTVSRLLADWQDFWKTYTADAAVIDETCQFLIEKYSEKHRAYHNLSHIEYLLHETKKIDFEDFESIFLAVWFHDAVYEPERSDNEAESAELAVKILSGLSVPDGRIDKIERMILATRTHSAADLDGDGRIFLDLDLSILGADEKIYRKYSQAIRQEYAHVEENLYRQGRKRILENFLKRETIYFTGALRARFEKQARLNLAEEIRHLTY